MTTPTDTDLAQALRELIKEWRIRVPATAPSTVRVVMREWCADELERVVNAHERAQPASVAERPLPMETAPRDGTMIRLLVDFTEHATEDTPEPAWTIGANNDANVGDDEREGWKFAGWCWTHDHFTQGEGTPVGWLPMLAAAPQPPAKENE